jgi:hypothetical protein
MKKIILTFSLCWIAIFAHAQDEYTLKFLSQINQSSQVNASNRTDAKITIGLPALSSNAFYLFNNGFTYNDLILKNADGSLLIQPGNVIDKLKLRNHLGFGSNISILSFNYATPKFSAGFSINEKVTFKLTYPGDLFKMLWNGNGAYLGDTLQIGNFEINANYYREFATHFTYTYKKWQFGLSPKFLFGKANINTAQSSILFNTDANYYALSADANMNVQTSGFPDSTEQKNNAAPTAKNYIFNTANKGYALDASAKFQYNEKLNFVGGFTDWGYISWKSRVHNYTMDNAHVTFSGVNIADLVDSNSTINSGKLTDSLQKIFHINHNQEAYNSRLPLGLYAMANYQFNKHHSAGVQLSTNSFHKNTVFAMSVCYQYKLSKHFSAALTYTNKTYSPFNLGGGLTLQFLGMQYYFVTDNWWAAIKPLASKNMNFRFGMNIVIGNGKAIKDKTPEPIMTEQKPAPEPEKPQPTEPKK